MAEIEAKAADCKEQNVAAHLPENPQLFRQVHGQPSVYDLRIGSERIVINPECMVRRLSASEK
jgi:hypothetical protein